MEFKYDPAKDAINRKKHGVSLAEAENLEFDKLIATPDTRFAYGEPRMIGYAPMGQRLYCIVFVEHGNVFRTISLRKANKREKLKYETQI